MIPFLYTFQQYYYNDLGLNVASHERGCLLRTRTNCDISLDLKKVFIDNFLHPATI
jgi:hypothetical protein